MTAQVTANPPGDNPTIHESGAEIPVLPGVFYQIADYDSASDTATILDPTTLEYRPEVPDLVVILPDGTEIKFLGMMIVLAQGNGGFFAGDVRLASIEDLPGAPAAGEDNTDEIVDGDGSSGVPNELKDFGFGSPFGSGPRGGFGFGGGDSGSGDRPDPNLPSLIGGSGPSEDPGDGGGILFTTLADFADFTVDIPVFLRTMGPSTSSSSSEGGFFSSEGYYYIPNPDFGGSPDRGGRGPASDFNAFDAREGDDYVILDGKDGINNFENIFGKPIPFFGGADNDTIWGNTGDDSIIGDGLFIDKKKPLTLVSGELSAYFDPFFPITGGSLYGGNDEIWGQDGSDLLLGDLLVAKQGFPQDQGHIGFDLMVPLLAAKFGPPSSEGFGFGLGGGSGPAWGPSNIYINLQGGNDYLDGGSGFDFIAGDALILICCPSSPFLPVWTEYEGASESYDGPHVVHHKLVAQGGDDWIYGGSGPNVLFGDLNLSLPGFLGEGFHGRGGFGETLYEGGGEHFISTAKTVHLLGGNDWIYGGDDGNLIIGDFNLALCAGHPAFPPVLLDFVSETDSYSGSTDYPSTYLLGGNDWLFGGAESDIIIGDGQGVLLPFFGFPLVTSDDGPYVAALIQNGDDYINGGGGDDFIVGDGSFALGIGEGDERSGSSGAKQIGGNDTIKGGGGDDLILGDGMWDFYVSGNDAWDGPLGLLGGNDWLGGDLGSLGYGLLDLLGSPGDSDSDYVIGGNDIIDGGFGNDEIFGNGGDDTLNGNEDRDKVFGGTGSDLGIYTTDGRHPASADEYYDGNFGPATREPGPDRPEGDIDTLRLGLTVDELRSAALFAELEEFQAFIDPSIGPNSDADVFSFDNLPLTAVEWEDVEFFLVGCEDHIATNVIFGDGERRIEGTPENDLISGVASVDLTLIGFGGDDIIFGNLNNAAPFNDDTIYGDEEGDLEYVRGGDDKLFGLAGRDSIFGDAGDDLEHGAIGGDDKIEGFNGRDTISGDAGDDMIFGDAGLGIDIYSEGGNDTIFGNTGRDELWGDSPDTQGVGGSDVFGYNQGDGDTTGALTVADIIRDFEDGKDLIGLSQSGGFNSVNDIEFIAADTLGGDAGDTAIRVTATGEILAVVDNVDVSNLNADDVVLLP